MFAELPISLAELERYRIETHRRWRSQLVGGHITRQRGQSLEFSEYARYTMGDDIRHVDWRASQRTRGQGGMASAGNWLVRKFDSEDHFELVVSIDTRDTMWYPAANSRRRGDSAVNISKIQVARWLAHALGFVALRSEYHVALHALFGDNTPVKQLSRAREVGRLSMALDTVCGQAPAVNRPNWDILDPRILPPAAVWIIITDAYFDVEAADQSAERIANAKRGNRWVMVVELDSWPYERALLEAGPLLRRIEGPGVPRSDEVRFDTSHLDDVEARIVAHKRAFLERGRKSAELIHWRWLADAKLPFQRVKRDGEELPLFHDWFCSQFLEDEKLQHLFRRDR